ncbi:unnamed protein product [Amoebophrya sp. A120]|nr:unnamed protein product [Amoebophrya sp. A120]|eukprot:GSA120T00018088001.1
MERPTAWPVVPDSTCTQTGSTAEKTGGTATTAPPLCIRIASGTLCPTTRGRLPCACTGRSGFQAATWHTPSPVWWGCATRATPRQIRPKRRSCRPSGTTFFPAHRVVGSSKRSCSRSSGTTKAGGGKRYFSLCACTPRCTT